MKKMLAAVLAAALCPLAASAWYGPVSDAEEQVAAIVRARSQWEPAVPGAETVGFLVTDLDHNGRLEVLVSDFGGTGLYTYTDGYEVNEDRTALVRITKTWSEGMSEADIMSKDKVRAYTDGISGIDWYVLTDFLRDGREYHHCISALSLQDGRFVMWPIANAFTYYDDEGGEHTSYENGDGATISEREFQLAERKLFSSYERANVRFAWLLYHADKYGDDWLSADDETIKERLLDSYRAFADAETEER